jgi:hypothetical protein
MMRIGNFAVVFAWYPSGCGWAVRKWRYKHLTSWKHGAAYLGRLKIMW